MAYHGAMASLRFVEWSILDHRNPVIPVSYGLSYKEYDFCHTDVIQQIFANCAQSARKE